MHKKSSTPSKSDPQPDSYAIVEASGTQFWIQTNRYYDFNRISADVDEIVTLENVLLINEGKGTTHGKP